MELGIKLSLIEDIKEDVQKRYNSLKRELKNNGGIADGNKQRAVCYANDMLDNANKQFLEIKRQVEVVSKTDRVAKQIVRNMESIEKYKDKVYELCGSMTQNNKKPLSDNKEQSDTKPKFIPKSYPRAWEIELNDEQRENLKRKIEEDERKYKELSKQLAEDKNDLKLFGKLFSKIKDD